MAGTKLISIKLKSAKLGQQILQNLSSEMTVKELKAKIQELTNIQENLIKVLIGFPPKPLDISNNQDTIETCGIKNGDTLIIADEKVEQQSSGPASAPSKSSHSISKEEEEFISRDGYEQPDGIIMKQVVPADNSCLFTSFGYILNGKVDTNCGSFMREIIASHMKSDPSTFNEGECLEYFEYVGQGSAVTMFSC